MVFFVVWAAGNFHTEVTNFVYHSDVPSGLSGELVTFYGGPCPCETVRGRTRDAIVFRRVVGNMLILWVFYPFFLLAYVIIIMHYFPVRSRIRGISCATLSCKVSFDVTSELFLCLFEKSDGPSLIESNGGVPPWHRARVEVMPT